jgi:xylulokinase
LSFLGIDLGTSGLRAMLMDKSGLAIRTVEAAYTTCSPAPGWSEQDPKLWIDALDTVVEELRTTEPLFANLVGIGVAGHMHGATLLDDMGNVLRPCILWNDTRAAIEAAALDQNPVFREVSGNIVFPGFTAPKLAWIAKHEPEIFIKTAKVLLPAAYLNYYLTGDYVTDLSDSAGTSWLDVHTRDWSDTLLSLGGMDVSQMPKLVEGCDTAGTLRQDQFSHARCASYWSWWRFTGHTTRSLRWSGISRLLIDRTSILFRGRSADSIRYCSSWWLGQNG